MKDVAKLILPDRLVWLWELNDKSTQSRKPACRLIQGRSEENYVCCEIFYAGIDDLAGLCEFKAAALGAVRSADCILDIGIGAACNLTRQTWV